MAAKNVTAMKGSQRRHLRALAHKLDPVVLLGQNSLTESVLKAIEQALKDHELIKVRLGDDKHENEDICQKISAQTKSECAGTIGHIGIFYRSNPQKKDPIILPK